MLHLILRWGCPELDSSTLARPGWPDIRRIGPLSSLVSDLLGISARRTLQALADGETDPAALATLAAPRLRELQPPLPQRQSADATRPQPSRQCCGEG